MKDEIYGIIQAMRAAKSKYCKKHGIEESFFCTDITAYQMDMHFETALRKVVDFEQGYNRFWKDGGKGGGDDKN